MLPRADGFGIANHNRLASGKGAHDVRNEAVKRPITAADDVSGTRGGHGDPVLLVLIGREKGTAIGGGDQFGATFAAAVRVVSSHRLVLAIRPVPLLIFVALVAGDDDYGADAGRAANGIKKMDGSENVN